MQQNSNTYKSKFNTEIEYSTASPTLNRWSNRTPVARPNTYRNPKAEIPDLTNRHYWAHTDGLLKYPPELPNRSVCTEAFRLIVKKKGHMQCINIYEPRQANLCRACQILTAHAQPFRGARDLAFFLKVLLTHCL